jgi:hypothetical protein
MIADQARSGTRVETMNGAEGETRMTRENA